jgi:hypothetical protein
LGVVGLSPRDWQKYRDLAQAMPTAAEKGRLVAAQEIATNPEARKRVEDALGVAACAQMYPECYRDTRRFSGIVRFMDTVRSKIPW